MSMHYRKLRQQPLLLLDGAHLTSNTPVLPHTGHTECVQAPGSGALKNKDDVSDLISPDRTPFGCGSCCSTNCFQRRSRLRKATLVG